MAETKVIQLTLDERDAEAVCGAVSVAIAIVTGSKAGTALAIGQHGPEINEVLLLKDGLKLGCAIAELYGLPCPHHHGKKASKAQCVEARADALARVTRIGELLLDFAREYRKAKMEAFLPEGGNDWSPTYNN